MIGHAVFLRHEEVRAGAEDDSEQTMPACAGWPSRSSVIQSQPRKAERVPLHGQKFSARNSDEINKDRQGTNPFRTRSPEYCRKENEMKSNFFLPAIMAAAMLVAGCSTTAGAGEDLQSAGKAITKSSEDARK